jgi:ATP-binding cassette subfamily B (MDR/TAP) protein 1
MIVKVDPSNQVMNELPAKSLSDPNPPVGTMRFVRLNKPEWGFYVIGMIGAAASGVIMPFFSILFTSLLTALGTDKANFWALMFVFLSIANFVCYFSFEGLLGYAGAKLVRRVRGLSFEALLRQEIGFFDEEENTTGALTAKLSDDASLVPGVTARYYASFVQGFAGLLAGFIIAFLGSWQLTLVVIGLIPLMGVAGFIQFKTLQGFGSKTRLAYEKSSQIATQAFASIRTVVPLTQEKVIAEEFKEECIIPHQLTMKGAYISALSYAFSQLIPSLAWSVSLYYGSRLVVWKLYNSQQVLQSMFAIIFTSMILGLMSTNTPDIAKARLAAQAITSLLNRKSKIDYNESKGEAKSEIKGNAAALDVSFEYPTRKDQTVLNGLSSKFDEYKTIALVGHSGCGKSTVIALLERWYDSTKGSVLVDQIDVKDWNISNLRSHMALVGQEPILFNYSIRENIAYGALGQVDDEMIYHAAKMANIHNFVMELPQKYDTLVGERGNQLSGGQKQRIAIARALIRNPKLLLLDEATSALDSESEKVVQIALDEASKNRTTIVIAHRLSTIQNADLILVIKNGVVSESGTHEQLYAQKGLYYELAAQQTLSTF